MAKRLNKNVNLVPPRRGRLTPGNVGEENVAAQDDIDKGFSEGDMVSLYSSLGDHAANLRAVARERIANNCIDISDQPEIQRHLAIMYLENQLAGGADSGLTFSEESEVPLIQPTEFTAEEEFFNTSLQNDLRSVGLDTIPDAGDLAPLTLNLMVLKNLPTRLCGSDVTMIADRVHETFAVGSLQEAEARADEEQNAPSDGQGKIDPLNNWIIIWVIFMVFIMEFGLLFIMKQVAGFFSRWPLKPIYNFLRGLVRKVLRKISTAIFRVVLGASDEEADQFRQLQIQQILLFGQGANPLVQIGQLIGIV